MADTQYKTRSLVGLDPIYPAIGALLPLTPCRWAPFGALMRAQDTIPATSRRVVAEWSLSGADDFAQPDGTSDPGDALDPVAAQIYPDNSWRTLGNYQAHVTPGCELRAHVLYCPAGIVQKQVAPVVGDTWAIDGAWAELRIAATWTGPGATVGPLYHTISMEGADGGTYTGAEPTEDGGCWQVVREKQIVKIRPLGYDTTPATAQDYSEWSDVLLAIQVRGGARVIHVIVYEVPLAHVTLHSDTSLQSIHAAPPSMLPMTPAPMIRAPNGATYNERRHGTRKTMEVAERQSERLGPRIAHWTCWDESDASIWDQAEGNPWTTSSASFVEITPSASPAATYDTTMRGHVVGGAHAQLHRLCDPSLIMRMQGAVVPARVRVDASRSAGTGTVRVQCGEYEWVDVSITGGRAWYEATGYLASQVHADHDGPPLARWGRTTAGTLSVYSISIDFGTRA